MSVLAGSFIWDDFPRSALGKRFVVNVPGRNVDTICYRVTGYSVDTIRFETVQRKRSELSIGVFRAAIADGTLLALD